MHSIPLLRTTTIIGLLASLGLGGWLWQEKEAHAKALTALETSHDTEIASLASQQTAALADAQERQDQIVKSLTTEHEKVLDSLRKDQRKQMTTAFKEFEDIFEGNKRTINYIDALESRVTSGQAISQAEVAKLAAIATGISFLQKEYQKPFTEFKQLDDYLAKQAANLPKREANEPARFGFFKRMLSKDFREAEKQQLRDEGAQEAFSAAQIKFTSVYANAQKKMTSVGKDAESNALKLQALMDEKRQAGKEDLSQFFEQARKALRTHQEVLDFEPSLLRPWSHRSPNLAMQAK